MMRIHGKSYDGVALLLPTQLGSAQLLTTASNVVRAFFLFRFTSFLFWNFSALDFAFYVTSKPAKACEHSNDELTKLFGRF